MLCHLVRLSLVMVLLTAAAVQAAALDETPAPPCNFAVQATSLPWGVDIDATNLGAHWCLGYINVGVDALAALHDVHLYSFGNSSCARTGPGADSYGHDVVCTLWLPAGATASIVLDTHGEAACFTASAFVHSPFFNDDDAANDVASACTRAQRSQFQVVPE